MKLHHTEIGLPAGEVWLDGILAHSPAVPGLVIVTERSGRTLTTARGAYIAAALQEVGFATLQLGLLSHDEERHASDTWNQVPALTARIAAVLTWIQHQPALKNLPLGIVAQDTAAAAMIRVAARADTPLRALVCRNGRPDFAGLEPLRSLVIPLLLLAGERDADVLQANRQVVGLLDGPNKLAVVPGASRGFEEPGTLDEATQYIIGWFVRRLATRRA